MNIPGLGKKASRTTARSYLRELVNYGGIVHTRGFMIKDVQKRCNTAREADMYLFGHNSRSGVIEATEAEINEIIKAERI